MARKPYLTDIEKSNITLLRNENYSIREIAKKLKRGKSAIGDYIKTCLKRSAKQKPGPKPKISERTARLLVKDARKSRLTARKVLGRSGVGVSLRTVQRMLAHHEHMEFGRLAVRPKLSQDNVKDRFKWARDYNFAPARLWRRTVFTDEKRFCLDGPDGQACFWADKRLPKDIFAKRTRGGGGIMVWGGISWRGKTPLVEVNGTLNADEYVHMLEEYFLPFRDEIYPDGATFQQDNAAAHSALHTRDFFADEGITDLPWPAKSPDMNCIENAWGELSRRLYDGGRQFDTVSDLREALFYEWDKLDLEYIRKLIKSMPDRVDMLRRKRGGVTTY